jgi:hypothetical protein
MSPHQDLGRLLLLRLWVARPVRRPRGKHRRDGIRYDRRNIVSVIQVF